MENMSGMKSLASSLIQVGQGILTIKQLRNMKVPVLAIASTALLAGLAYRAFKTPSVAEDTEGGKKAPIRKPSGPVTSKGQSPKGAAATAVELGKDAADRIRKEYVKYKKSASTKMRSYDKMLGDIKSKLGEAEADVKEKYSDVVHNVEKRSKELRKRLMTFKAEGKDEWTGFKREFTKDIESLGKELKGIALS